MRPMVCRPGRCRNLEGNGNVFAFFEGRCATFEWKERVNLPLSAGNKKVKPKAD
jgi:hypothetical protein